MTSAPPPLGLIGLGLMGSALAERWLAAGFAVVGFDLSLSAVDAHRARGGIAAASVADVFTHCDIVVLSLPDDRAVSAVLPALPADDRARWIVDTTTGDPRTARVHETQCAAGGARLLEATISGSSEHVRRGAALVLLGGDADDVARCATLWPPIATEALHVGPVGHAGLMKLVSNLVLGLNRAALAEGLGFARALGLDLPLVLRVLQTGPAASRIMETKGPKILAGDYTPQAKLSQHLKDVMLIQQLAADAHVRLPLSSTHCALLAFSVTQGWGDLDNSVLARLYERPDEPV